MRRCAAALVLYRQTYRRYGRSARSEASAASAREGSVDSDSKDPPRVCQIYKRALGTIHLLLSPSSSRRSSSSLDLHLLAPPLSSPLSLATSLRLSPLSSPSTRATFLATASRSKPPGPPSTPVKVSSTHSAVRWRRLPRSSQHAPAPGVIPSALPHCTSRCLARCRACGGSCWERLCRRAGRRVHQSTFVRGQPLTLVHRSLPLQVSFPLTGDEGCGISTLRIQCCFLPARPGSCLPKDPPS